MSAKEVKAPPFKTADLELLKDADDFRQTGEEPIGNVNFSDVLAMFRAGYINGNGITKKGREALYASPRRPL